MFFSTWSKTQDKNLNFLRTKRTFKMNYKTFFRYFQRTFIETNVTTFFGRQEFDFKLFFVRLWWHPSVVNFLLQKLKRLINLAPLYKNSSYSSELEKYLSTKKKEKREFIVICFLHINAKFNKLLKSLSERWYSNKNYKR